jgi:hypothetical protein
MAHDVLHLGMLISLNPRAWQGSVPNPSSAKTLLGSMNTQETAFSIPGGSESSATASTPNQGSASSTRVDFTHMTSRQLLNWINTQIASGKMSLDESSNYLGLTLNGMPLDPGADDSWRDAPRDYIADLNAGLDGAQFRGDKKEIASLLKMLDYLKQLQTDRAQDLGRSTREIT